MSQKTFEFTKTNQKKIAEILSHYPKEHQQSGLIPLLHLAQDQNEGWLSQECIEEIARLLNIPPMRVYEVASFYTMFNLEPRGKYLIQLCRTTPCWLRGCDDVLKVCADKLGIAPGETTENGLFSLVEVECLGGCANAPIVQINDDYYEDLDPSAFSNILDFLAEGKSPPPGSAKGRQASKGCLVSFLHDKERKEP